MLNSVDIDTLLCLNKLNIPLTHHLPDVEIYWFNVTEYSKIQYTLEKTPHHHTFFELHFILSGEIVYNINDRLIALHANDYLIIPPKQSHKVERHTKDVVKMSLAFAFISSDPLLEALLASANKKHEMSSLIKDNILFIIDHIKEPNNTSIFFVQNRIYEIIYNSCNKRLNTLPKNEFDTKTDERLLRAKKFVCDNLHMPLSCEDIANYCHLSSRQLRRLFETHEHKPLLQYIHDKKIEKAQELLLDTEKKLSDISSLVGFSNEHYFNSFFKKMTGITPGDYRKSITPKHK